MQDVGTVSIKSTVESGVLVDPERSNRFLEDIQTIIYCGVLSASTCIDMVCIFLPLSRPWLG